MALDQPPTLMALLVHERGWTMRRLLRAFDETAAAANAEISTTDRSLRSWLSAERHPLPPARLILEKLFDRPIGELLAPPPAAATGNREPPAHEPRYLSPTSAELARIPPSVDLTPPSTGPAPAYSGPRGTHVTSARAATNGAEGRLMAGADDTFDFLTQAARSETRPEVVRLLQATIRDLVTAFPTQATALVDRLLDVQRTAFRLLDGPTRPASDRDIYFAAAIASGLLARIGVDLSQPVTADVYARAAHLCADRAGSKPLTAWIRTEQARSAYWSGAPETALNYLAAADTDGLQGSIAARVAVQRARAYAALGRADEAREHITIAAEAREHFTPDDLDDIGGETNFRRESELFVASDALMLLPIAPGTETAVTDAVTLMTQSPDANIPFGNRAGAQSNLALLRLRQGDIDGAREALSPVLTLPPEQRNHGVRTLTRRVRNALNDPRYGTAAPARAAAAELEAFYTTPNTRTLPS